MPLGGAWRRLAPVPVTLILCWVAASALRRWDGRLGFDYPAEVDYLRYVDTTFTVPLADRGWQFYTPPGYVALSVTFFELIHRLQVPTSLAGAGRAVSVGCWAAAGLATYLAARRMDLTSPMATMAAAVVWLVPGESIVATMVYPETFTTLTAALVVLALAALRRGDPAWPAYAAAAYVAAPLAKYTAFLFALAAAPAFFWLARERLGVLAATVAPGALVALLYYGRNLLVFHTPFPENALLYPIRSFEPIGWGRPPGFWTRWDLGPEAMHDSFWGGTWKWWWASGVDYLPWRTDVKGAYLLLCLLTTAALLAGLGWAAVEAWRRRDALAATLAAAPLAVLAAYAWYCHQVPGGSTVKGSYLLLTLPALGLASAGLAGRLGLDRGLPAGLAYAGLIAWSLAMARGAGATL